MQNAPSTSRRTRLFRFLRERGITRFVYGGNAFLYQITMAEYAELTALAGRTDRSGGDHSRRRRFFRPRHRSGAADPQIQVSFRPGAAHRDPRDAAGSKRGLREIAEACGVPLLLYVKQEADFGNNWKPEWT